MLQSVPCTFAHVNSLPNCYPWSTGESKLANKLSRAIHSCLLESGLAGLSRFRNEVRGVVSDQGTERSLVAAPMAVGESNVDAVQETLRALRAHEYNISDDRARQCLFLPRALQIDGVLHVVFNALERGWTSQACWSEYEPLMKDCSNRDEGSFSREASCSRGRRARPQGSICNFPDNDCSLPWAFVEKLRACVSRRSFSCGVPHGRS